METTTLKCAHCSAERIQYPLGRPAMIRVRLAEVLPIPQEVPEDINREVLEFCDENCLMFYLMRHSSYPVVMRVDVKELEEACA